MAVSATRGSSGPVLRSLSPSGRFYARAAASSSAFASSTSSSFSSRSTSFFHRPAPPTCVNLHGSPTPSATAVRFPIDGPISPSKSITPSPRRQVVQKSQSQKKTCMCSPTTHPGSFRCSLHKNNSTPNRYSPAPYQSNRLNARHSAMTNSLVRIGTVEGDLMKRALAALIRPSSHHQRRRTDFQRHPSPLFKMSKAEDL